MKSRRQVKRGPVGRVRGSPATRRPPLPQGMPPARCATSAHRLAASPRCAAAPAGGKREGLEKGGMERGRDGKREGWREGGGQQQHPRPRRAARLREGEGATWRAAAWDARGALCPGPGGSADFGTSPPLAATHRRRVQNATPHSLAPFHPLCM